MADKRNAVSRSFTARSSAAIPLPHYLMWSRYVMAYFVTPHPHYCNHLTCPICQIRHYLLLNYSIIRPLRHAWFGHRRRTWCSVKCRRLVWNIYFTLRHAISTRKPPRDKTTAPVRCRRSSEVPPLVAVVAVPIPQVICLLKNPPRVQWATPNCTNCILYYVVVAVVLNP